MKLTVNLSGPWKLYAGPAPIPDGATIRGTVRRSSGAEGALVEMPTGIFVQWNAGVTRSLPQREIKAALEHPPTT